MNLKNKTGNRIMIFLMLAVIMLNGILPSISNVVYADVDPDLKKKLDYIATNTKLQYQETGQYNETQLVMTVDLGEYASSFSAMSYFGSGAEIWIDGQQYYFSFRYGNKGGEYTRDAWDIADCSIEGNTLTIKYRNPDVMGNESAGYTAEDFYGTRTMVFKSFDNTEEYSVSSFASKPEESNLPKEDPPKDDQTIDDSTNEDPSKDNSTKDDSTEDEPIISDVEVTEEIEEIRRRR